MKRCLAGLLVAFLAAAGAANADYVLIMKDGSRVNAKAKPEVKGRNYVYKTPIGTTQMVLVADVDEAKTEAANKDGTGLQEIEAPASTPAPPTPTAAAAAKGTPDIVELARRRKAEKAAREQAEKEAAEAALATPTPTPTPKKKS